MKIDQPNNPPSGAPEEPMQRLFSPESIAAMFDLTKGMLQSWRNTNVGPPYYKTSRSERATVRYTCEDVRAWQKKCLRVVPDNWQPTGTFPGENEPSSTDKVEWLPPKRVTIAIGVRAPTLTAWRKRIIGLPFTWIGGGGEHQVVYELRDIETFISRRQADPSVTPAIPKKAPGKDPRTLDQRAMISARIWKEMGHSDEEIRRRLGSRRAKLFWPQS
jgi:hypothetical protein